jgi:hypothetical protein
MEEMQCYIDQILTGEVYGLGGGGAWDTGYDTGGVDDPCSSYTSEDTGYDTGYDTGH